VIANIAADGLRAAGQQTGLPPQPVQEVKPVLKNADS
jgi:hypothetical protein